jgi:adenosine kinase
MRAAAWLLPPNSVVYSGCIGNDKYGKLLKEESEKDGLKVVY